MDGDNDLQGRVDRLEERLRVLSESLRAFAEATSDYALLLDVVAQTLATVIRDGCVVRLLAEDGWLEPAAIHLPVDHVGDADAIAELRSHIAARRNLREHASGRRVIETGEPLLASRLDLEQLRISASPDVVRAYEMIGIHSVLMVALRVRGESIGLLSLVRFAPGSRPFDEQDRHLAQALADHAALAIANSRLVRQLAGAVAEQTTEIKVLRELLPICAWCKRVRDDDHGSWGQIEAYVAAHTDFTFTHGICPECARNLTDGA